MANDREPKVRYKCMHGLEKWRDDPCIFGCNDTPISPVGAPEPAAPHCPNCGETEPKHPNVAKGCYVFWGERNLPADEWYWENERAKAIYCATPGGDAGAPPPALCVMCGEAQAVLVTEPEEARWGAGPLVTIASPKYRCHACGEAWYTADQADRNFAALFKATIAALESQLATERLSRETAEREREELIEDAQQLAEALRIVLTKQVYSQGPDDWRVRYTRPLSFQTPEAAIQHLTLDKRDLTELADKYDTLAAAPPEETPTGERPQ